MRYGKYVGRVGALAIALGVGALAPAVASADTGDTSADRGATTAGARTAGESTSSAGSANGTTASDRSTGTAASAGDHGDSSSGARASGGVRDGADRKDGDTKGSHGEHHSAKDRDATGSGHGRDATNPVTTDPASGVDATNPGRDATEPGRDREAANPGTSRDANPGQGRDATGRDGTGLHRAGDGRAGTDQRNGRVDMPDRGVSSRPVVSRVDVVRAQAKRAASASSPVEGASAQSAPAAVLTSSPAKKPSLAETPPQLMTPVYESVLQAFGLLPAGPTAPAGGQVMESLWGLYRRAESSSAATQNAIAATSNAATATAAVSRAATDDDTTSTKSDAQVAADVPMAAMAAADSVGEQAAAPFDPFGWIVHTFLNAIPTFAPQTEKLTLERGEVSKPISLGGNDAEGDPITYTVEGKGTGGGTLYVVDGGKATYKPPSSWDGKTAYTDTFTVKAEDSGAHLHGLPGLLNVVTLGLLGDFGHATTTTVTVQVSPVSVPDPNPNPDPDPNPDPNPNPNPDPTPDPQPAPGMKVIDAALANKLVATDGATVSDSRLDEISGIVAGAANPNVYWVHNDSGGEAEIFAIDAKTVETLGVYALSGAKAKDWEDIAIGAGPEAGKPYIYVGDIGDNGLSRSEIVIYRVAEPEVNGKGDVTLNNVETLRFKYPDGAHNSEGFLVDPKTGDLVIIEKAEGGEVGLYHASAKDLKDGSVTTLQKVGTVKVGSDTTLVTGADISRDGTQIAVRTYGSVYLFQRDVDQPLWSAFAKDPIKGKAVDERQGEAITFHPDGTGYVTLSEGVNQVLHHFTAPA